MSVRSHSVRGISCPIQLSASLEAHLPDSLSCKFGYSFNMVGLGKHIDRLDRLHLIHRFRSEEHTSELQSRGHLVCRLMLEHIQPPSLALLSLRQPATSESSPLSLHDALPIFGAIRYAVYRALSNFPHPLKPIYRTHFLVSLATASIW